jgi:tetratricopeptide (TPR) repeat protein
LVVDKGILEPAFQEHFALALETVVLATLSPSSADRLGPLLPRLRNLVGHPPSGLTAEAKASLFSAAARGFESYSDRVGDNAVLREAIAAYRATLHEVPREQDPLDWARREDNLGSALEMLAERESGTASLEEAVAAYRAALEERTRQQVPLDWARTQKHLGQALYRLGERSTGTALLEEGLAALRAALEEITQERVPLEWAQTQIDLGAALYLLGERESGTARLEEASRSLPSGSEGGSSPGKSVRPRGTAE